MTAPLTLERDAVGYFGRLGEAEERHWWSRGMWRIASYQLDRALRGRRGLRAVDVGSGTGAVALRLADRPEIATSFGIEPNPGAIGRIPPDRQGVHFARGDARALPFPDASLDLVTCFDVLQHLPAGDDRRAMAECRRVLRPGGWALIRTNARGHRPETLDRWVAYQLDDLSALVADAGLRVRWASPANCLPAIAAEFLGRLSVAQGKPSLGNPAGHGLRLRAQSPWKNLLMGGVASAEAFAAGRLGWRLPYGHSLWVLGERAG
jgi:SAM-dependent methyltransferase